ncbi:hypothetical protein EW146_g2832 [Bondarzewia mesenterica]|uniref:SGT1-domain-containing protein n=1 Tax=Bondarzewia mesenterica TaxID=1095465 RepID=A0A4S4LZQ6_9AGAM|nr:hypothetical protein EW146_g2832 [Bondarzewia mesenterica]
MDDIFNRTPSIAEDTLQYSIYPAPGSSDRASVTTFAVAIQSFVDSVLAGFIWHRDSFELKVVEDTDNDDWMLEGRMRVGDSVDDEWCTVWLLREISAKWDLVISVYDSDGEFLLIEAADSLPSWVTPSNAENRVWIYKSRLHLIDLSHVSPPSSKRRRRSLPGAKDDDAEGEALNGDQEDFIDVNTALSLVRDTIIKTLAPAEVEQAVWQRISGYPTALKQHVHTTKAILPVDVAKALSVNPSLVQKAVETFYTRDALQLRAAHKMSRFPPDPSTPRLLTMSRTAYAQLVGQKFYPPKIFGRWQEKEGSQEWRWKDIGMKIACGFEMLYQESKGRSEASKRSLESIKSSSDARKDALRRNSEYTKYIRSLMSAGYFQGELEGSLLWNALEDKAAEIFVQTQREDDASRPSFASLVTAAILKASPEATQPSQGLEDSDDWLNVDAQDFDRMLEKRLGVYKSGAQAKSDAMDVDHPEVEQTEEDRIAKEQASKLQDLAKKVENFLGGKGDIEGAKFEDEQSSGDEMSELSDERFSDNESESDSDDRDLTDDAARAARQEAMDKLVPGIHPSEYGQMPASFHSHSQRVASATVETDIVGEVDVSAHEQKPVRPPILPRDKYEGVESDEETDEEEPVDEEEDEEDRPQVVGEMEVDMEEETDEFLEFSRQALGISDEQWGDIIRERKSRGAFVPSHVLTESRSPKKTTRAPVDQTSTSEPQLRQPQPGPRPNANPKLDSFEAVMQAMDAELSRSRSQKTQTAKPESTMEAGADKGKGKAKATTIEEGTDIEAAMDAELQAALERGEDDEEFNLAGDSGMDYNLIKNFLESFRSQAGLSGPVSNLAGRLQPGWSLPRDET